MVLFLTLWNTFGVQFGKWLQNVFTVTKIGSLIAVIVIALLVTSSSEVWRHNFREPNVWSNISQTDAYKDVKKNLPQAEYLWAIMVMGGALVGALFSADAWNNVTFTAGEVRQPERNLPLSLMMGTGGVIVLYLIVNCGYLASLRLDVHPPSNEIALKVAAKTNEKDEHEKLANPTLSGDERRKAQANLRYLEAAKSMPAAERGIKNAKDDRVATALVDVAAPGWALP